MTPSRTKAEVELWTDGSTVPQNPGHGGWAAILYDGKRYRPMSGYEPNITNNNMETQGVLRGLQALIHPCKVNIFTDSMYVIWGIQRLLAMIDIEQGRPPHRKPEPLDTNMELWECMLPLLRVHEVKMVHVKGHCGIQLNEWANDLAGEAARSRQETDNYVDRIPKTHEERAQRKKARAEKRVNPVPKKSGASSHSKR